MHKDHYENLFYCLSGEKIFTLCPPADIPFLHEKECESGTFKFVETSVESDSYPAGFDPRDGNGVRGRWVVELDRCEGVDEIQKIRWIEPDITRPDAAEHFPQLKKAHPVTVRLREGEMLYLPALWYHRVTQSCETVGINYWYDMRFDSPSWCYFNFLQHLKAKVAEK